METSPSQDHASSEVKTPRVSIVIAVGRDHAHNHVIGRENKLLWHIKDDLKRFKELTMGHPVIMGRKTFESILEILKKPMPGRTSIVVTRDQSWNHPDQSVVVAHSLEEALKKAKELDQEEIFIGGGAEIYAQSLRYVDKLYMTYVDDEKEGDSFFPKAEDQFPKETFREERLSPEGIKYTWVDLERA